MIRANFQELVLDSSIQKRRQKHEILFPDVVGQADSKQSRNTSLFLPIFPSYVTLVETL